MRLYARLYDAIIFDFSLIRLIDVAGLLSCLSFAFY